MLNRFARDACPAVVINNCTIIYLKIKLLTVDYARAEFNDLNGQFRFGTDNAEETSRRLIQLLAENGAAVDTFSIGTASLEEVFRMVVGANAD